MPEILLAEDNPADVYLIREALREYGVVCSVRAVADGKEALALIAPGSAAWHPDLIILDLNLPCHDGLEILQKLRSTEAIAHVPVVVLTSSDSPRDRLNATELGATRYLRKPSDLEQFLQMGAVFRDLLVAPDQDAVAVVPEETNHEA